MFKSLRHCVSAGEPINPDVMKEWKAQTGLDIHEGYGQTETVRPALQMYPCMSYRHGSEFHSGGQEKMIKTIISSYDFSGKSRCNKQHWKNLVVVNHRTIVTAWPKTQALFFMPEGFGLGTNTKGVYSSGLQPDSASEFSFRALNSIIWSCGHDSESIVYC